MGIEILELTPERVVGTMPVAGNTQPYGLLHGGASAVLAETLGSLGAAAHAATQGPGWIAMGVDLNITHVRGAREGAVTGVAIPVHLGRTVATYVIDITDQSGRTLANGRLTCALRDRMAT
nr:hotdog fold thioesterase [Demequina pelophila]